MQCRKFSRHVNSLNEVKSNCTFMLLANCTPDHDCVLLCYTLCRKNKHEATLCSISVWWRSPNISLPLLNNIMYSVHILPKDKLNIRCRWLIFLPVYRQIRLTFQGWLTTLYTLNGVTPSNICHPFILLSG